MEKGNNKFALCIKLQRNRNNLSFSSSKSAVMADKRSRVKSSADVVFDNDDLLLTILLFVPAKRLICMKVVAKRWHTLVSAESFRCLHAQHRRRSDPPPSFIIRANSRCFFYFSPMSRIFRSYVFPFHFTRILQSSHGLLLLEVRKFQYGEKGYHVYNPITGESRNIPIKISRYNKRSSLSGLCLAFDQEKSVFFKVISIRRDKIHCNLYWIEIYDSQTSVWTQLKQPFTATNYANFFDANFWNNGICWIRKLARSYYLDLEKGTVGTPQRVLTHKKSNSGSRKSYVMESNGHLHYVSLYFRQKKLFLKVSELLDDLVWLEKYKTDLNPISCEFPEMLGSQVMLLCIARGDKEEDSTVFFLVEGKIIFYRFCDGYFSYLFQDRMQEFYNKHGVLNYKRNHAHEFIESLVPV